MGAPEEQPIRPAATVVLLREAADELEVLLLRRNSKLVFYGGAWVFPGGRIDEADLQAAGGRDWDEAARLAAARELMEEAGLSVAPQALLHFALWVTPPGRPRRFDTWYFAAPAPEGRVAVDDGEVDAHRWQRPALALQERDQGQIELPPPTVVTLSQLLGQRRVDGALQALRRAAAARYEPRLCSVPGGHAHLYPGDAGYATREPERQGRRHRLWAMPDCWRYQRD